MRKYLIISKNSIQTSLAYRFNTLSMFFTESIFLVIMLYLWTSIYRQGGQIGTYSLSALMTYFILSRFVALITLYDDTARKMNEEITEGGAINYFLKPLNYLHKEFAYKIGTVAYRIVLYATILLLILLAAGRLSTAGAVANLPEILVFILFLLIGISINFFIFFIIGLLTFYVEKINGFNFTIITFTSLFSGNLAPLDLFPSYLAWLGNFLPFKFVVYLPIAIATHRIGLNEAPGLIITGLAWVFSLYFLARLMLYKSFRHYEAYG